MGVHWCGVCLSWVGTWLSLMAALRTTPKRTAYASFNPPGVCDSASVRCTEPPFGQLSLSRKPPAWSTGSCSDLSTQSFGLHTHSTDQLPSHPAGPGSSSCPPSLPQHQPPRPQPALNPGDPGYRLSLSTTFSSHGGAHRAWRLRDRRRPAERGDLSIFLHDPLHCGRDCPGALPVAPTLPSLAAGV